MQARRRREARAQLAFDELIATVRAEDPKLAAEEARAAARPVDTHCGHACYGFTRCGYTALHCLWVYLLWLHPLWLYIHCGCTHHGHTSAMATLTIWQARKQREQLRHERRRRGWLVKLLRQARG